MKGLKQTFEITPGRKVGKNHPVYLVAEVGVNHNWQIKPNLKLAKELIMLAKNTGFDAVKFQTWVTGLICRPEAKKAEYQKTNTAGGVKQTQYQMIAKLELPFWTFLELKTYADSLGITFVSTADEPFSLEFLDKYIGVPFFKIGSGELDNPQMHCEVGKRKKPVMWSTGMGTMAEVMATRNNLLKAGCDRQIIYQCTSNYPADNKNANLNAMLSIRKKTGGLVGLSDHTTDNLVSETAAALGAVAIERHITIDKNLPGPDHRASLDPKECQDFVRRARHPRSVTELKKEYGEKTIKSILGSAEKKPVPEESEVMAVVRKSATSGAKGIPAGTKLTEKSLPEWVYLMRPQNGEIKADQYFELLSKTINADIPPFTPLKQTMLR
ncbi:N-acetylneuraminate synthase family protein [Candidatus Collierbacteria bacterium]|nr:N-acetylneuraminate synthase family protein [Candidatus Collierbacteria bacterium]